MGRPGSDHPSLASQQAARKVESEMGRVMRRCFWGLGVCSALAALGLAYFLSVFPRAEPASLELVERTPERLERGAYLAEHVAVCTDCHSERDFSRFTGPVKPGSVGQGGERFGHEAGLPGDVYAANITPYRLAGWTDGEIVRAITSGVSADGRALFPIMPYPAYAQLCEEDLFSLVSYVRTLAPVPNDPPQTSLDFPVNLLVRTLPSPATPPKACPDPNDSVAYGRYLVNAASCADCHTKRNGPDPVVGQEFAGGNRFPLPGGTEVVSRNITPDRETGIGSWSKEAFINRFKAYRDEANLHPVQPGDAQTVMPWSRYAWMSERDLGAIYDFLRTLRPVRTDAAKPLAQR